MKIHANAKNLLLAIQPALIGSTKDAQRNNVSSFYCDFTVKSNEIVCCSFGGEIGTRTELNINNDDIANFSIEDVKNDEEVRFVVKTNDFKAALMSFDESDVCIDIMQYAEEEGNDSGDDNSSEQDAFDSNVVYVKEKMGSAIRIILKNDPDQYQTMPMYLLNMEMEDKSVKNIKNIDSKHYVSIGREVFVSSAKRLLFSRNDQESYETYKYWVLRKRDNILRFVMGNGRQFAALTVQGEQEMVRHAEKDFTLYIPSEHTPVILDILDKLNDDFVDFIFNLEDEEGQTSFVLRTPNNIVKMSYAMPEKDWPDEDNIINARSKYRVTTKVSDWDNAIQSIQATYSEDMKKQNEVHLVKLEIDEKNNELKAITKGSLSSQRKINIHDYDLNKDMDNQANPWFISHYIINAIKAAPNRDEFIQIEIGSEFKNAGIVRLHANKNISENDDLWSETGSSGFKEQFVSFFVSQVTKL